MGKPTRLHLIENLDLWGPWEPSESVFTQTGYWLFKPEQASFFVGGWLLSNTGFGLTDVPGPCKLISRRCLFLPEGAEVRTSQCHFIRIGLHLRHQFFVDRNGLENGKNLARTRIGRNRSIVLPLLFD